jgi:hypothetical protein
VLRVRENRLPASAALIGDALTAFGAAAVLLLAPDDAKVPLLLVLGAALVAFTAWMSPAWRYTTTGVAALTVAVAATLVYIGVLEEERPQPDVGKIVAPAEIPPCSRVGVRVIGEPPPNGWAYAVAQRDGGDDRYYFEPLRLEGQEWVTTISTFRTPMHLWLVAIEDNWLSYLQTTTDDPDDPSATYWSSPDHVWPPPEAVLVHDAQLPMVGEHPDGDGCPDRVG